MSRDISCELQQQVLTAYNDNAPLRIVGGNTKGFYGRTVEGEEFDLSGHSGVVSYEPTELVITARAGTTIREIQNTLDEKGQMLAFEPPLFDDKATLGGTVACNLSGPRRASAGAARDFVLGTRIINGKGEKLSFGGEVMKNVAGYDVSRLMTGALGTLGVLLDISLKVLPKPELEHTRVMECDAQKALDLMQKWSQRPVPVSATCFADGQLVVRLSGAGRAVEEASKMIGGMEVGDARNFWSDLTEQRLSFFKLDQDMWRLSLAPDVEPLSLDGEWIYEWGGALRWLKTDVDANAIVSTAEEFGGHATLFKSNSSRNETFQALSPGLKIIHTNLKNAFDPKGILNPGKMYADL